MRVKPGEGESSAYRTIPLLIDDVKQIGDFQMTRCTFFRIEAGAAVIDFVATLRGLGVPFAIFGSTFVIDRPAKGGDRFEDPAQLNALFDQIEDLEGLVVETSHLWLPNQLFHFGEEPGSNSDEPHPELQRGSVWRLPRELFALTLQFQRESLSAERLLAKGRELLQSDRYSLHYSSSETEVFRAWSAAQIRDSIANYEQNLKQPGLALAWRDEAGETHAG